MNPTIRYKILKRGIKITREFSRGKLHGDDLIARVFSMRKRGMKDKEIGEKLGFTKQWIWKLRKLHVKRFMHIIA